MKLLAAVAAIAGIAFGALFALGPFYFGTPTGSLASFIMPVLLALAVVRTNYLNLRRLRDPSAAPPRWRLLTYNLVLLSIFLSGITVMYQTDVHFRHMPTAIAVFLTLGMASFGINALYLCLPTARAAMPAHQ